MENYCERTCKICSNKFYGYMNARYCDKCNPQKNKKKRFLIKPNEVYGVIRIIARGDRSYVTWICKCEKCGFVFEANASGIKKYRSSGCPKCHENDRKLEKTEKLKNMIGMFFGQLKVIEILDEPQIRSGRPYIFARCECQKCGGISDIPVNKLNAGQAKECADCARKNLKTGTELVKILSVDGTLITAIDGRRNKNKNNVSGYNGVSKYGNTNKWRAYINFRRKQYHLGLFDNIEDAVAARKEAEQAVYGDFIDWYKNEYPEQWEKIQETKNK